MNWLFNNMGLKLLSLTLAAVLWAYVTKFVDYQDSQSLNLPVRVRSLDPKLIIADKLPEYVEVRVRGSFRKIRQMDNLRLAALLDCSGITEPGTEDIRVQVPDIGDVRVTYQNLEYVRLSFDIKKVSTFPVLVQRRGELDRTSYDTGSERLSSDTVEVTGPQSFIDRIASVRIEPNINGATENVFRLCEISLHDIEGDRISSPAVELNPERIEYSLEIVPIGTMKNLTVTPIYRGQPPQGYTLYRSTPRPRYISVEADLVPSGVFTVPTEPIDLSQAKSNFTADAKLAYPFELPGDAALPTSCEVIVEVVSIDEVGQGGLRVTVELSGDMRGFEYTVDPPALLIQSDRLLDSGENLPGEVAAFVDVEGLGAGEYRLVPQMSLPLTFERVTIIPSTVKVTIFQSGA